MPGFKRREWLHTVSLIAVTFIGHRASAANAAARRPARHKVRINAATFHPTVLTISMGDSVVWVNEDIVPHTATAIDSKWDTKILKRGQSKAISFAATGDYDYLCRLHPSMTARIQVK